MLMTWTILNEERRVVKMRVGPRQEEERVGGRGREGRRGPTHEAHRGNTLPAPPHVRNSTRALPASQNTTE